MELRDLLALLRRHTLAVQATVSAAGQPQAAVVGVAFTDDFEVIFDTLRSTRKFQNLCRDPKVSLVIGGWQEGDERTVQIEGQADEPVGGELDFIRSSYYAAHPDGAKRASWPGLTYVRVRPTWIRYSDYNANPPQIIEYGAEQLALYKMTG